MSEIAWTPTTVKLGALDFWERNPKRLTKAQAKRLADSTDRLGRAGVLLVGPQDARGRYPLYDGHQRANIWRTLYGADAEVHALQSNRELSEDERLSVSVLTVTAVGSFDFDALAGWDAGVLQDLGLGVDYKRELDDAAANIAAMLEALRADEEDRSAAEDANAEARLDIADELQEKWRVQPGDLWQLGEHRLICGDCTDRTVIERVMDGEKATMVWTDPPYGVNYGDKLDASNPMGYRVRSIQNDNLPPDELEKFIRCAFHLCADHSVAGAVIYVACPAGTLLPRLISAFDGSGFVFHWGLVWVKDQLVLSRADYHFQHENILYGWKDDAGHKWTGDRKQSSVFFVDRPKRSDEHPTMKPVKLVEQMLTNNSSEGEIVLDPFLGSGTTLIACQNLGRKCRGVEIEPKYVAVTLQRWADATGRTPVRLENAK